MTLDVLVHCAAYRFVNPITFKRGESLQALQKATLSASWERWDYSHNVNVLAPYFLTAGLIDLLGNAARKGEGRGLVILFSSPASVHNHQFVPAYQTTKAAVDHLVRILAAEFADFYSKALLGYQTVLRIDIAHLAQFALMLSLRAWFHRTCLM